MVARIDRTALEEQERKYKQSVKDLGEPSEVDTTNSLKYDKANKTLKYDALQFLNENAVDEDRPENQAKDKVFIKYQISKYTQRGRDYKGNNKVLGFMRSTKDETRMDTETKDVRLRRVFDDDNDEEDGQEVIHTFYVDVSDIVLEKPGRGLKDWAKDGYRFSNYDNVYRAKKIQSKIKDAITDKLKSRYRDDDDEVIGLNPRIWDTSELYRGSNDTSNYFFDEKRADRGYAKALKKFNNEGRDHNTNIDLYNEFNPKFNNYGRTINNFNKNYNKNLRVKEDVYKDAIKIANQTAGGDYTDQREKIRLIKKLEEAGINAEDSQKILGDVEDTFKAFYRDARLKKFNFGSEDDNLSYINTKAKPPAGTFDPDYYKTQSLPHQTQTEQEKWNDAVADDDIDITERFGDEVGFYLYRYGQQRGLGELRGNAADPLDKTEGIVETAPTDAEIQTYRDDMLTIQEDDPQAVLDNVAYIKTAYEDAIKAREDGTPNKFVEAAGDLLNVNNPDEFLLVYRQVGDEADLEALRNFSDEGFKITDLEDAITGVLGEEAIVQTKKFGALTQNVLTDTMNELKRAKAKEQELATMGQFSTFGEIMDINKSLTDSLLGDTGVGGFLGFAGKNSGFDPKTLEKQLSKVTGVNNNVIYNWQEWFDDSIKKNYSEFEDEYLTLGYTKEEAEEAAREEVNIQKSFAESYITNYLQPRFNESRSMHEFVEYLDVQDEEQNPFQTQSTLNALNQVAELKANKYIQDIQKNATDQEFDYEFYFDPTGAGKSKYLQDLYQKQKNTVEEDWDTARDNPQVKIRAGDDNAPTWAEAVYQYGVDVEDQEAFARLHYQVKGQFEKFDPAKDVINPGQVQEYIDKEIVPLLVEEAGESTDVFGQFIRPDEYADEMLEGLDPNVPESWEEALTGSDGESLLGDFTGDFEDLRGYLAETFRTGSAENIRRNIKYLNEKREKPTQELLGVEYIQREEDYKTDTKLQGDTQLFKTFQSAGYEGSEDDFYKDVFPDLDKSTQSLLSQVGEKGTFEIPGLSGFSKNTDPYEAFVSVGQLLGDDTTFGLEKQEEKQEDEKKSSYFTFDVDYDEDYKTKKSTSGSEFLNQFTQGFSVYG